MVGEKLKIASEAICGSEPYFHRAGDFQTIFFSFLVQRCSRQASASLN
jgi:hypothetical protein